MLKITRYGEVTRFDLARTIAGRGRYWTSCYLVDSTLIDSGPAHTASELVDWLGETPIQRIFNTHSHEDHIGANGLLQQQRPGVQIFAHPGALTVLADPRNTQPLQMYRRLFWGWPTPSNAIPISDKQVIQTGRHCFQVIYTPGHSRDHICLYETEQGWVFSGDLYVGGQDRALGASYEIWEILASLKQIASLPVKILFPGSARVRQDPQQSLSDKIAYLEGLGEQIMLYHQQGYTVTQISRQLFGSPMLVEWVTQGRFSRRNLVKSFLRNPSPVES